MLNHPGWNFYSRISQKETHRRWHLPALEAVVRGYQVHGTMALSREHFVTHLVAARDAFLSLLLASYLTPQKRRLSFSTCIHGRSALTLGLAAAE
jgi:hypothetical protein